ncbi:MAG: alpha/beta hydrolase [Chitinophagales bacterium]
MKSKEVAQQWRERGQIITIDNRRFFVIDEGNKDLPVLLFLHGYPSCSFDFVHVLPKLSTSFRVIVHDHLGFGYSDKPTNYSYSLIEQADYALRLWENLGVKKAHLIAHDYGTSVATEILAQRKETELAIIFQTVTLTNGSIHIELADLRFIQKLLKHKFWGPLVAKFSNEYIFVHQMRRLWFDQSKADLEELKALWIMGSAKGGKNVLPAITQYLNERYQYWDRWIGSLKSLDIPTHILWAQDDPVSVKEIGELLYTEIPPSEITRLENLGHYPMIEDPQRWTEALTDFLSHHL